MSLFHSMPYTYITLHDSHTILSSAVNLMTYLYAYNKGIELILTHNTVIIEVPVP